MIHEINYVHASLLMQILQVALTHRDLQVAFSP